MSMYFARPLRPVFAVCAILFLIPYYTDFCASLGYYLYRILIVLLYVISASCNPIQFIGHGDPCQQKVHHAHPAEMQGYHFSRAGKRLKGQRIEHY